MHECPFAGACGYLKRPPEALVVNGFRLWVAGYQTGDIEHWSEAWNLFSEKFGHGPARHSVTQLAHWVRSVFLWRTDPIQCFSSGCPHICRDECLAVAMIAACQHRDGSCLDYCLERFCGFADHREPLEAALGFASALDSHGQRLMSVPCEVVRGLIEPPESEPQIARTYH
ncbi:MULTISPECIES: hypothetical protein [Afifella]|uniref:hypothetical protein n=1 Tax=Afifella TaxID=643217 RepID=UPI000FE3C68D|nr:MULTISPECIES: hypothetical protein [Afifella]MCT8268044.1 hypothetical protein [Afifella sp. JA880]